MPTIRHKGVLWYLFCTPAYVYRLHLGWLFGKRLLLLTHTGRRSGRRRQTVLEVIVANGFGPNCDLVLNIQAHSDEEVTVGWQHFAASHRFVGEEEAAGIIRRYEHRNRFIARWCMQALAGSWDGNIAQPTVIGTG